MDLGAFHIYIFTGDIKILHNHVIIAGFCDVKKKLNQEKSCPIFFYFEECDLATDKIQVKSQ